MQWVVDFQKNMLVSCIKATLADCNNIYYNHIIFKRLLLQSVDVNKTLEVPQGLLT
jgi:hypothetical protein